MLEGNFLEDFSADCLHPGDEGAAELSWEVLDLGADSRECLAEVGSLEASGSFPTAMAFGCWEPGAWEQRRGMTLTRDSRLEPSEDLGTSDKSLLSCGLSWEMIFIEIATTKTGDKD